MPKQVSVFSLWRDTCAGLSAIERDLRKMLKAHSGDSEFNEALSRLYLKVSDSADAKLKAELSARQILHELRDRELGEMTPAEVQAMFDNHATRSGLRSVSNIRDRVRSLLDTPGSENLSTEEVLALAVPPVSEHLRSPHSISQKLRNSHATMQGTMDEGAHILSEALASSEGDQKDCVVETTTGHVPSLSDEESD